MSIGIQRKRVIRISKSPKDLSTIVSIYPKRIVSINHTIFPGRFTIEPGTYDKPSILVVGMTSYMKEDHQSEESIEIPVGSIDLARSIVTDWVRGLESCSPPKKMPGVFFIEDNIEYKDLKKHPEYKIRVEAAREAQENWYKQLIDDADVAWSKANRNPRAISDDARAAAEYYQLKDKEWMQDFKTMQMVPCPACGELKNAVFPICPNCKFETDPAALARLRADLAIAAEPVKIPAAKQAAL